MRTLWAVTLLVLAGACAGSANVRVAEDGSARIDCSGGYYDWSRCHSRAERHCGRGGYDILSQVSNEGASGVGSRDWSREGSEVSRTMIVRCRD